MPETPTPLTETPRHADVAAAIDYLVRHYADQPSLDDVAQIAGLSPHHFQRTFKAWTGVSPKRFLQYVTLGHAKRLLSETASLLDASLDLGLSGPGRLHDLFVACEAVTPGEYKQKGRGLAIRYGLHDSPLGRALIGVTDRGICRLGFVNGGDGGGGEEAAVKTFAAEWPQAELIEDAQSTKAAAEAAFELAFGGKAGGGKTGGGKTGGGRHHGKAPRLLVIGTNFQIKVWEALLHIPRGGVVSYQDVARAIGSPNAVRAVGRAVGGNPIALLIPCHRVILKSGAVHNYRWGAARKRAILALEQAGEQAGRESPRD